MEDRAPFAILNSRTANTVNGAGNDTREKAKPLKQSQPS
jgi:hypothetical protein